MKLNMNFFINNHALPCTTLCKDLGITVDNNLTPSPHVATITATANQRASLIYRMFVSRDIHLLVRAFVTYVRPVVEYNTVIWSPFNKCDIERVEKVQRRFTNGYLVWVGSINKQTNKFQASKATKQTSQKYRCCVWREMKLGKTYRRRNDRTHDQPPHRYA